jgi:UDP-N-acetylglucosamine 2-epimerase
MKIITVVGARPQFIKAAVVSRSLRKRKNLHEVIIHTGQHYDANMSDIFFEPSLVLIICSPEKHLEPPSSHIILYFSEASKVHS